MNEAKEGPVAFPIGIGSFNGADLPKRRDELTPEPPAELSTLAPQPQRSPVVGGAPAERPLSGVRIVDLTNTWAAPRAATLLAELGADVIKLEGIEWMDMLRGFTEPPPVDPLLPIQRSGRPAVGPLPHVARCRAGQAVRRH